MFDDLPIPADMSGTVRSLVSVGNGGWLRFRVSYCPYPLFLRVEEAPNGRMVVADLFVPFVEEPPTVRSMRTVATAVADAEIAANETGTAEYIRAQLAIPGPLLRTAAAFFATPWVGEPRDPSHNTWLWRMLASQVPGSNEPQASPVDHVAFGATLDSRATPDDLLIKTPNTRPYPDDFYEAVAELYELAAPGRRPSADIAEANGIPVKTVHYWVSEARRRGLLAPARRRGTTSTRGKE